MPDPQKKIKALIESLEELRLHIGRKDLSIGSRNINSQLFFSLANACLRNRAVLLYGGMGANKTTLVNLLGTSFLGSSMGDVENLMVTGHPEQTEEKIVGFLDPRQWTRPGSSTVEVLWTPWARSRWKLINEINRFPSGKQNLFLEILQKRKISYAGQVLEPGDTCYFATMNPEFSATYPLDEALLDRISVCVPAMQPDFLAGLALSQRSREVWELAESLPPLFFRGVRGSASLCRSGQTDKPGGAGHPLPAQGFHALRARPRVRQDPALRQKSGQGPLYWLPLLQQP